MCPKLSKSDGGGGNVLQLILKLGFSRKISKFPKFYKISKFSRLPNFAIKLLNNFMREIYYCEIFYKFKKGSSAKP